MYVGSDGMYWRSFRPVYRNGIAQSVSYVRMHRREGMVSSPIDSWKPRMIGVMSYNSSWEYMDVGPLVTDADTVAVGVAV